MQPAADNELIGWSKDQFQRLGIRAAMAEGVVDRVHSGLGGSHTVVTYPPLDALDPISATRVLERITPVTGINLYYHVAFCEFICPFCHYDTWFSKPGSESRGVAEYMEALHAEISMWRDRLGDSSVASLYIGGGTPTALSQERLEALLSTVSTWRCEPGLSICIETSPLTLTAPDGDAKLSTLIAGGVGRISIGVQTFDENLLRRSRGHGRATAIEALNTLAMRCSNINIDLIQDLPGQTDEHLLADLREIGVFRPAQVTWYMMRLRPESGWYKRFQQGALEIPAADESVRRRLLITEGMRRLGYTRHPGGRFVRDDETTDQYKSIRAGLRDVLLGMGVSAYSHGWGYLFRNTFSRDRVDGRRDYVARVGSTGDAIYSGAEITELEHAASDIVSGIRTGVRLPDATVNTADYLAAARERLHRLTRCGLTESIDGDAFRLTEVGSLLEEEICSLFYTQAVRGRLTGRDPYWANTEPGEAHRVTSSS